MASILSQPRRLNPRINEPGHQQTNVNYSLATNTWLPIYEEPSATTIISEVEYVSPKL